MGANNSTRRVSFESDENDNVTVVKGIRLSENVINRMREPSGPQQTPSPPQPTTPSAPPPPPLLPVHPPFTPASSSSAPPPAEPGTPTKPSPPAESVASPAKVDENELRRKIAEELQKGLEQERSRSRQELRQWMEKERAQMQAQAHAQVQDKVSSILATERATSEDGFYHAALRERITADNEKLRAQTKKLEERERTLKKQEAFYQEQVAKLEERSAQFYKVTNENYHKALDEVNAKFKRYEVSPLCPDLQDQILKCYRENAGRTLLCSNIASLYLQCVNNAKQEVEHWGINLRDGEGAAMFVYGLVVHGLTEWKRGGTGSILTQQISH